MELAEPVGIKREASEQELEPAKRTRADDRLELITASFPSRAVASFPGRSRVSAAAGSQDGGTGGDDDCSGGAFVGEVHRWQASDCSESDAHMFPCTHLPCPPVNSPIVSCASSPRACSRVEQSILNLHEGFEETCEPSAWDDVSGLALDP